MVLCSLMARDFRRLSRGFGCEMIYQIERAAKKNLKVDHEGISYGEIESFVIEIDIHGKQEFESSIWLGIGFLLRGMFVWERK